MRVGGTAVVLAVLAVGLGRVQFAVAQSSPRVEARVSADSVKIGERFTVRLVAEHDADAAAVFPAADAGAALFGDLHVVGRGAVQSRRASPTRRVDSVAYEVTTFALDSARVPILPVRLVAGPDTTVAGTFPQVVPVRSVVEPDDEVLRTPALLASFPWPLWVWGALLLSALALAGGLVYAWRRWGEEDASASDADDDPPTPYRDAMERLQGLDRRNPTGQAARKAFYVDLTDTLRVYLARRLGVRALEQTTAEMLAALRRRPEVQEGVLRRLQAVLEQADLVKFADAEPSPERSQSVLEEARGVIDALESAQRRAESPSADDEPAPA
jgi:hypothetical protein